MSEEEGEKYKARRRTILIPCLMLAGLVVAMGLAAEPVLFYIEQAVDGLLDPSLYINAVLYG